MPAINPKAGQPANCPATSRYEASKRGKAPKAQKLNELPDADVYRAVYRHIGRCEAPIIVKFGVSRPLTTVQPKGGIGMSRALTLVFAIVCLRDLLRDLPLSDRLRRRFQLLEPDRRRRARRAGRDRRRHRCRPDCAVRASAQRHGAAGVQGQMDEDRAAAGRAQRLRARREHRADDPVPRLAADRRDRLERRQPAVRRICSGCCSGSAG